MNLKHWCLVSVFVLCLVTLAGPAAWAQASLAAENMVDDIVITVDGVKEAVSVVRDGVESNQWYYIPNKPRLVELVDVKTKEKTPMFHILKYQAKDPKDTTGKEMIEGGILQMAVNLALGQDGVNQIKEQLAKKFPQADKNKMRLGCLPVKDGKIAIYGPGGEELGEAPQAPDIAPTFANQSIPVQIKLNKVGADVMDALCKGGGGIPIYFQLTYQGLTPPAGFKVECDWDQTFKHVSSEIKAKAELNTPWVGVNAEFSHAKVRENLETNKCMKIEVIAGEQFKAEDIDKYLEPVIEKIGKELFEIEAPEKIDPAKANDVSLPTSGRFFNAGCNMSFKDVEKRKKGKTTWDMRRQQIMDRTTVVGGLIGIGQYSKAVQDKCITIMPPGNWASAFYSLPDVGNAADIGVTSIDLTVKMVDAKGGQIKGIPQETVKWTKDTGTWKDAKKNDRDTISFAMQGVYAQKGFDPNKCFYNMDMKIVQIAGKKTSTIAIKDQCPLTDGQIPVVAPLSSVTPVTFIAAGKGLTWAPDAYDPPLDNGPAASDLKTIGISLKTAKPVKQYSGTFIQADMLTFLIENEKGKEFAAPIDATITFNGKAKKVLTYKNLIDQVGDTVKLMDQDYLE